MELGLGTFRIRQLPVLLVQVLRLLKMAEPVKVLAVMRWLAQHEEPRVLAQQDKALSSA